MQIEGGDKLVHYLEDLAKHVSKPGSLSVGFFEGKTYPDGTPVALVAAVQNFGAPAKGIPPRPFFSNMVREKASTWGPALGRILPSVNYDAPQALGMMGELIAGDLRVSIQQTNSPPLKKSTIARKGFAKPLIDSGVMYNSVEYKVTT